MKKSENSSKRFVSARKQRGLTQEQFAEMLGISGNYVYLIESGKKPAGPKLLEKLELLEAEKLTDSLTGNAPAGADVSNSISTAATADLEKILTRCVEIKDWGGAEKIAAELHRRALFEVNKNIKNRK